MINIDEQSLAKEALEVDVELILTEIYRITGYDFKDYSAVVVMRRLQRRLICEGIATLSELLIKIRDNPDYAFQLITDFSINVTEMFRNPHFFKYFRAYVIPHLKEYDFIRIWAAGCSTGEEVYSLAILLHEEGIYHRCRVYATDMNEDIIHQAKSGGIPIKKMQDYSDNYMSAGGSKQLNQYFYIKDGAPYLYPDLMKNILFSHHNLTADRSFNEFHVIFCRNVLIYFNQWLRNHVHSLLFDSLALNGYLALGHRESIRFTQYAARYINLNPQEKLYQRVN